ncbi:MAG: sigma-54-dependent Fis family transcriptional regulator [Desulfovibrio sp.]|nr:sigma-54-dependent Fis family transcriptional regulator [Desulfovibrio sp.]MBI4961281.1 sigma-54-dependent Fis family transcriptional regulator [Desulfovibrio sp.]
MTKNSVLLVEDELSMLLGMQHALSQAGYEVATAGDAETAQQLLRQRPFDLVITDLRLPGKSGMELLEGISELYPGTGVILITAFPEVELAVQAIKAGAFDFLCKPFPRDGLLIAVERYFRFLDLKRENARLRGERDDGEFIGESPVMLKVFERIRAIAGSCVPVLVLGPSGSGKELVAGALHRLSKRRDKPFIKINCAALPEHLLESELFGHEKGAFTGAQQARKGKFEAADGGTLFFDEAGEMPLAVQAKLLRVLEDQEVTPVGGNMPRKVDVRTVFATARDLEEAIEAGTFREDLYYRINVVPVTLPPLRERGSDVALLAERFLRRFCAQHDRQVTFSEQARSALLAYDYPGNVRELRNAIERAVILCTEDKIHVGHLPKRIREVTETSQDHQPAQPGFVHLADGVAQFEKKRILEALEKTGGKRIQAAELLGITRKQLWLKLKELDIKL